MEEGERRGENCESREEEARGSTPSSGARLDLGVGLDLFAARLVDGVLKDTILESTETKIWSIPCSKECHNHEQEKGGCSFDVVRTERSKVKKLPLISNNSDLPTEI